MKYCFGLLVVFLLLSACAERSGTEPDDDTGNIPLQPGELAGSIEGVLDDIGQAYVVKGDITIETGKSLTIMPGSEFVFEDSTAFIVNGWLVAEGTLSNPIIFRKRNNNWAGIHLVDGSQRHSLKFCVVEGVNAVTTNSTAYGAIEINNTAADIINCIIRNNRTDFGGGLGIVNSDVTLRNNIIYSNQAVVFGGGIFALESTTKIINNSIVDNYSENFGGGIYFLTSVDTDIQNNIFFSNAADALNDTRVSFSGDSGNVILDYNFLDDGTNDPGFTAAMDFHLITGSVARDAGNPASTFNDTDGTRNDQGAYGGPNGNW